MWDWLFQFVEPLERASVPYAIVGSVASSIYGEPRATNDVDVLIQLPRTEAAKIARAFPDELFYVPPPEIIEIELSRSHGGHINVISLDSMMKADFYPVSAWEVAWFADRRPRDIAGRTLWFARPEAVIVHKLRFYREGGSDKHLRDIRSMLAVSGDEIDRELVERAVAELGLEPQWRIVQET
ncbi:MAG: hypothetical protein HZA93_07780 [Verrucomicrobia bacterium]|nr:hypothetical protein [Verrucomicrobiota bacterium]